MKNLGIVLLLSVGLVACDKAEYDQTGAEPASEDLAAELENTPKVADPEAQSNSLDLNKKISLECYNPDAIQNASKLGYKLVVVIDKAKDAQTFKVYRDGQLVGDWLTSTGKELSLIHI